MRRQDGFTMVELITVMILLGVLAAVGIPRLMGDNTIPATVFGDQVTSALRMAQKTAVARRRTVCVSTGSGSVQLRIASAPGGTTCNLQLDGIDDDLYRSSSDQATMQNTQPNLFFRPDGSIAASAGGAPLGRHNIAILWSDSPQRTIELDGRTGLVN